MLEWSMIWFAFEQVFIFTLIIVAILLAFVIVVGGVAILGIYLYNLCEEWYSDNKEDNKQ